MGAGATFLTVTTQQDGEGVAQACNRRRIGDSAEHVRGQKLWLGAPECMYDAKPVRWIDAQ
jgi:hypothetical protein